MSVPMNFIPDYAGGVPEGVSSLVNDRDPNFQKLPSLTYTSVTSNGLVTSFPPTTASKVIVFKMMAVEPIIFTDTSWISAFLYHIPPLCCGCILVALFIPDPFHSCDLIAYSSAIRKHHLAFCRCFQVQMHLFDHSF